MGDLRDISNIASEPVFESNFARPTQFDHASERIDLSGEGLENSDIRPLDENSEMGAFRTVEPEVESGSTRIMAAVAVALILGGAGFAGYMSSMKSSASGPAIAAAAPAQQVAAAPSMPTPVDNTPSTATPVDAGQGVTPATPQAAPAPFSEPAAKPTRSTTTRSARADVTPVLSPVVPEAQPAPAIGQQQAAATPAMPEPLSPTSPTSSMAANTPAPALMPSPAITPEPQAPVEQAPVPPQDQQANNQVVQPAQPSADQPAAVAQSDAQPVPETVPAQPQ